MHVRFATLLFVVLSLVLTACPGPGDGVTGGAPQITSFTANPETITAAGQAVALSWTVTNGVTSLEIDSGVGAVSGTSEVVYPSATTTYTLTASNSSGSTSATVDVSVGPGVGPTPGPGAEDGLPPTLNTFGVSPIQSGFQSDQGSNIDDANDPRIVRVQPNGTFYAVVSASDPGGIAGVTIVLANSSPSGLKADLAEGQSVSGFTLNGEVSGCVLDGTQTSVTCVYEIAVGNIPNVTALPGVTGEFAYVFRTRVADASGLESDTPPRGYVIVGDSSGTPNSPPNDPPPSDPPPGNPPANRTPNADFTFDQQGDTLTVAFSGARSSDPDGDSLKYAWNFGNGKTATTRDFRNTYAKADKYKVSLKVTDPDGKSDTETKTVTVEGADTPNPPPGNPTTTYALTVTKPTNGTVTSKPGDIDCGDGDNCEDDFDENKEVTLIAKADAGYEFSSWGGACESATDETCVVVMSKDQTVTVAFSAVSTMPEFSVSIADVDDVTLGEDGTATAQLNGTTNNAPSGVTTYLWTAEGENKADVTFATPALEDTTATFSDDGMYKLRLTATNGTQSPSATVDVEVKASPDSDPVTLKVLSATYATNYRTQDDTSVICDNRATMLVYRFTYEGALKNWRSYLEGQTSKEIKGERIFEPDSGSVVAVGVNGFEVTYTIPAGVAPYQQGAVISPKAIGIITPVPQPTSIGETRLYLVLNGADGKSQPFASNNISVVNNCP